MFSEIKPLALDRCRNSVNSEDLRSVFTFCRSSVSLIFALRSSQTNNDIEALLFNDDCYTSVTFTQPGWSLSNNLINIKRKEASAITAVTAPDN